MNLERESSVVRDFVTTRGARILASMLWLVGCGGGGSSVDGPPSGDATPDGGAPDAPESGFRIGGSALGVRAPRRIDVVVAGEARSIDVTEDGTFALPMRVPDGTTYAATLGAGGQACVLDPTGASGSVAGADALSMRVTCDGLAELRALQFSIPVRLAPGFDPGAPIVYDATRPLFVDPDGTYTVTPTAAYPADSAITVDGAPVGSGMASVPITLGDPATPRRITIAVAHPSFPSRSYRIDVTGGLTQEGYLKASNTQAGDRFGRVAVSGDVLAVGAPSQGAASGAVYVFRRNGATWALEATIEPANGQNGDAFGTSVALDGVDLVVGAPFRAGGGAVYVYHHDGTAWNESGYLVASNRDTGDRFGASVGVSLAHIVVGAPGEDSAATGVGGNGADNSRSNAGAAYAFAWDGSAWQPDGYLKGSTSPSDDALGTAVAISGDTIVAGAPGNGGGRAFVYERDASTWMAPGLLTASNAETSDFFGTAVAISGSVLVIGAPGEDSNATGVNGAQSNNSAPSSGAAYVFRRGGTWAQEAYLKAANIDTGQFGTAVAISGANIVVGMPNENAGPTVSGAVHAFQWRAATGWHHAGGKKASNPDAIDHFGASVAIEGLTMVAGAPEEDSAATGVDHDQADDSAPDAGAAYVFR